jgi:hypothetical protein
MESILTSIKKMIGISEEYDHFDPEIIFHINSVFADLNQMGVGPEKAFVIEDDSSTWMDFLQEADNIESVKTYVGIRVKLIFDPPASSTAVAAMQREADKWEWRLNVAADNGTK